MKKKKTTSPAVTILAGLATTPMLLLGVGLVFHTSLDADVLGKYSVPYAIFLVVFFLVLTPLVYLFWRWLFGTQQIVLTRRTIPVGPRAKLPIFVIIVLAGYIAVDTRVRHELVKRTTTFHHDLFHPFLQNVPKPGQATIGTNRAGFRGGPIKRKNTDDAYRIFVFGGSTVFCGSLPREATHCGLLHEKLSQAYPDRTIDVQNIGADWHTSQHSLMKLLFTVQSYDPDLVIIYHAVNDLYRTFVPDAFARHSYQDDYGHYLGAAANLLDPERTRAHLANMYLGYWFSDFRFESVRLLGPDGDGINGSRMIFFPKATPVEVERWRSLRAFERNMGDFVRIARSKGMRVLLATQPFLYRDDLDAEERRAIWFPLAQQQNGTKASLASMIRGMEAFNDATRRLADAEDVSLVDLEKKLPKTFEYFYDDVHYTRAGNAAVAEAMYEHIVAEGWPAEEQTARGPGGGS